MAKYFVFMISVLMLHTASAEFVFLNTHPEASTVFPTAKGVKEMTLFNDKLYMGYGANGAETTPQLCPPDDIYSGGKYCDIKLRYLDPSNGQLSGEQGELRSQGMFTINVHSGHLYALAEDPDPTDMLLRCDSSSCIVRNFPFPYSAHNFVSVEYQNAIYIGGGHNNGSGGIWRSVDNGLTWTEERFILKNNSNPCCARVAFMAVIDGSLYAQAYQYDGQSTPPYAVNWQPQNTVHKLTGNTWTTFTSEILTDFRLSVSTLFNNKIIYMLRNTASPKLRFFDGLNSGVILDDNVNDFFISGDYLYVLRSDGKILQTDDLTVWQPVEKHSVNARQISLFNDTLFLSDKDGHIWVSDKTFPRPKISFLPSIYHFMFDEN